VPPSGPIDRALAAAIYNRRKAQNATQEETAHTAGLTVGTFGLIERGKINPTWTTVKGIAKALDITLSELAALAEGANP
jgi:transcriptional regulator with XRE-family HTH domain